MIGAAGGCWYLYSRYRRRDFFWWSLAWSLYALRIGAIAAFLLTRAQPWLFVHQILTGWTALVLLWAALTFTGSAKWRPLYAAALAFPVLWSYLAIYQLQSFMLAAVPAVLFLSFATFWTGVVFLKLWRATRSRGAATLAGVLIVWAIHHLDYPLLRAQGAWSPWGYYLDILFVLAMSIGIGMLVLEELDRRTRDLERLSARIVRQHEDERHRVSLELHDQTAQVWAVVKMQLGLIREKSSAPLTPALDRVLGMVDAGIQSIRAVTTNLRPPLLDDLGLAAALRALVQDFSEQTRLEITFEAPAHLPHVSSDAGLALYRALQEALANIARHAGATRVDVRLTSTGSTLQLVVQDNGRGIAPAARLQPPASTLGIAGMRERIGALHGSVELQSFDAGGASLTVRIPVSHDG